MTVFGISHVAQITPEHIDKPVDSLTQGIYHIE